MRYLLNFWLHRLLFLGTAFFAAATVGDLGLGGGDGNSGGMGEVSDGGGADDGSQAGSDTDSGDTGGDASTGDEGETDPNLTANPDAPVDLGDGRTVPAKWKSLFDQAQKAGLGKEVRQLYFSNQRLSKAIPGGVNGAITLAQTLEQLGGVEGVEQIQGDLETYKQDSDLFERGDPKWIESSFQENPEASLKAFNNSLKYLAENQPEMYDHTIAGPMFETLDKYSPVHEIYSLLAGLKDNPAAQEAAKKLATFFHSIRDTARKAPEKKIDSQQKALNDRAQQVDQKEMGVRYTQVNSEVFPAMKTQVFKTLEAEAKIAGVDLKSLQTDYPGAYEDMLGTIQKQIQETAMKDQRFLDKYYAVVKKGDVKRAAAILNAKHDRIIPDIVRAVAQKSGLLKGKKATGAVNATGKPNVGGQDNPGWLRVSAKPVNVDYQRTTTAMLLDGKAFTKDGKKVVWG